VTSPHLTDNQHKEPSGNRNRLILVGGLFLLGVALALLIFGGSLFGGSSAAVPQLAFPQVPAAEEAVNPLTGQVEPIATGDQAYSFALANLDGRPVALSDFKGQPVLVNFWATWCPPCRLEMPEFQRAFEAHQQDGLVILAVNEYEDADTVRSFFSDDMGFTYTALLDSEGAVGKAYGAVGLPASFFVAPDGTITAVHRGLMTSDQLENYLSEILP
jgi:peroxiredoxin